MCHLLTKFEVRCLPAEASVRTSLMARGCGFPYAVVPTSGDCHGNQKEPEHGHTSDCYACLGSYKSLIISLIT